MKLNYLHRVLREGAIKALLAKLTLSLLALFIWAADCPHAWATREISIYVPPFEGPVGLSRSVNTILRLQIWQTLRKSARQEGAKLSFGAGAVKWGPDHLPELSYRSAETVAQHVRILAQIVLWGTVEEYGGGAVVQAFLTLPIYPKLNDRYYKDFRTERNEVWVIRIPADDKIVTFGLDVPRRRVPFEPVVLRPQVIEQYATLDSIVMYDRSNPSKEIGVLSGIIDGVEQLGDKALVTSKGVTGIVFLPELAEHRSEIVEFASGLMRIFRGDWQGAIALFTRVVGNSHAPTDIRIDANLYSAMANAKLGRSGTEDIEQARALNPYAVRVVRFAIMDKLAELSRAIERSAPLSKRREIMDTIKRMLITYKDYFLRRDPWFDQLRTGISQINDVQ